MELFVGALAVLGFLAILIRFLPRDAAGGVRLPRIVDQSIGMWLVRRALARRRGDGSDDGAEPGVGRTSVSEVPTATATHQAAGSPAVIPIPLVASSSVRRLGVESRPPTVVEPARSAVPRPSRALRLRPSEAYRRGATRVAQALVTVAALTSVLVAGFVVAGSVLRPAAAPGGEVLAATGTPGPSPRTTTTPVTADTTAPKAAITGLSKKAIAGSTLVRVTITWTLTESGSGIRSQVLQRRIDNGAWETIALPSSTTRSVSQRLPRGHKYTFRVRAVDRAGNVGPFATRYRYL